MLRRATGMLFDRALGVREELLLEEADARPASERDVPRVGRALPRREPQERGLADPVRPDEPDPIGLGEPERDLAEDQPFAEALRDGLADPFAERPADRFVQPSDLVRAQRAGLAKGVDARAPERLDRVDVPDPGDRALVEEQRLGRGARSAAKKGSQPRKGEAAGERLLPERRMERRPRPGTLAFRVERRGVDDRHPTEFPGVREPERRAVDEVDLATHVPRVDPVDAVEKLSGHPQRDDEGVAAVEVEDHELAAPPYAGDPSPAQARGDDLRRLRIGEPDPPRLEVSDGPIDDQPT